jgi:two-component system alkaline phosphatase synthesis response regulator PhoP
MIDKVVSTVKVLVVDDEPKIVDLVKLYLERDGYQVLTARDGQTALAAFRDEHPDIIILDLMLPGISGLDVCRNIRSHSSVPVIMLTARAEEADKLIGLEIGADDYVTKPFSPRELAGRVRAVLRRSTNSPEQRPERIEAGSLIIDATGHKVSCDGKSIDLTPTEFRLLWALVGQPERVFSRGQLLETALENQFEGYERTIDAHVKNLRRKLTQASGRSCIETVYGVGYKFVESPNA